jgi:hypothetical protein
MWEVVPTKKVRGINNLVKKYIGLTSRYAHFSGYFAAIFLGASTPIAKNMYKSNTVDKIKETVVRNGLSSKIHPLITLANTST